MRWSGTVFVLLASCAWAQDVAPKAADARLVVELVAQAPDIVHPIACDFDSKGRLLVVESHTHFAPKGYTGPKHDRILAFDVSKGGKPTVYFEGTRHTMDLAVHHDGSVYLATRNEILRLKETKDGVKSERIVFLDTKGDYPHNGLSGLCFDFKGDLTFGMGENLGARYKLIGSDGESFSGEGDGGHIFHCTSGGKKLRRVATGFWNPFGICRDIYGRTFAVDNDPDQAPPCRMLHVVEGGDYGFRFCYGRSGKHPFQSWHGELPGTLPMMTGVGESPCEIISYESDGLPKEYLGQLLVTSWADHRVERYEVLPHGASFKAKRLPFVQGPTNFRPTGMCVAPDGSLYVCDWVKSDYTLHGKGAIWHIREKQSRERKRPADPKEGLFSDHRPLREAAARKLTDNVEGRGQLRSRWAGDGRVAAASLSALIDGKDSKPTVGFLEVILNKSKDIGMQELALRELVERRELKGGIVTEKSSARLQALAIPSLGLQKFNMFPKPDQPQEVQSLSLSSFFKNPDPFLRHAAVWRYRQVFPGEKALFSSFKPMDPKERIALLLAAPHVVTDGKIDQFLNDTDEDVRFLTVKWIADEKLKKYRAYIEDAMQDSDLSVRMYTACATALARFDDKDVNEKSLADYFAKRLADDATPSSQRAILLRQVPVTHPKLTLELLIKLTRTSSPELTLEAVRAIVENPSAKRSIALIDLLRSNFEAPMRAYGLLGLTDRPDLVDQIIDLTANEKLLRDEGLRALIGITLNEKQRVRVAKYTDQGAPSELVERVLGRPFFKERPPAKDTEAWLKVLDGPADAKAGGRIFFHPKLAGCNKCHRVDGRGADVGPDLSNIGRTDRRHLLESILQPSNTVAPHYVAWHLETADGKTKNGMLLHTQLDEYTYLDTKGDRFKIKTGDLVEQRPLTTSIMPDGLLDRLTDQEIRDLLAYLQSRK